MSNPMLSSSSQAQSISLSQSVSISYESISRASSISSDGSFQNQAGKWFTDIFGGYRTEESLTTTVLDKGEGKNNKLFILTGSAFAVFAVCASAIFILYKKRIKKF